MRRGNKKLNLSFQADSLQVQKDNKKLLRAFYKKQIDSLSSSLKKQKQKQILKLLNKLPFWEEAVYIAAYQALEDEPCLSSFYKLWKDKVCFPVMKDGVLEFYRSEGQWHKNSFSVFEPIAKAENKIPLDEISVFLIPGRAFDRSGGRLGRGKAYYDKTLAGIDTAQFLPNTKEKSFFVKALKAHKQKNILFIGLAFVEQIHNEKLPLLEHDVLLNILVTDQFVLMPFKQEGASLNKAENKQSGYK